MSAPPRQLMGEQNTGFSVQALQFLTASPNEPANYDVKHVWDADMDGLIYYRVPMEMMGQRAEVQANIQVLITFVRLINLVAAKEHARLYKNMKDDDKQNDDDFTGVDLYSQKAFNFAINQLKVFAKVLTKDHNSKMESTSASISTGFVLGVMAVASAPANFLKIATNAVESAGSNLSAGFKKSKSTDTLGKIIMIVEGLGGAWVLKLKYIYIKQENKSWAVTTSCSSTVHTEQQMQFHEDIYILDTGEELARVETIISKVVQSNLEIMHMLYPDDESSPSPAPGPPNDHPDS